MVKSIDSISKRMKQSIMFLIMLFLCFESCKSDVLKSHTLSPEEDAYFEDYDSPKYKWSYIDRSGKLLFNPIYDNCRDFIEGKAVVNFEGKWGIIDKKNRPIIPFLYKELSPLDHNNLAIAKTFTDKYLIINNNNDTLHQLAYTEVYAFSEGRARCKSKTGWGYINSRAKKVIPTEYQSVRDFKNNHAVVTRHNKNGLIDGDGNYILPLEFDQILHHDNKYISASKNNTWGLYDNAGKLILPMEYSFLGKPNDGKILAKKEGNTFIIDLTSKSKTKVNKKIVQYAGHGLWIFQELDKFGLCNIKEEVITPKLYPIIYKYQEGKAVYNAGLDQWGYLNADGTELTPPIFPLNWSFENGYGRVIIDRGIGFIDTHGQQVIPGMFREVKNFKENVARVQVFR